MAGIPERPIGLSSDETELWTELIDQIPANVLSRIDGRFFRELCSVMAINRRLRVLTRDQPLNIAYMDASLLAVDLFLVFSKVFGMSPKHREEMELPDTSLDDDDFEDLMSQE